MRPNVRIPFPDIGSGSSGGSSAISAGSRKLPAHIRRPFSASGGDSRCAADVDNQLRRKRFARGGTWRVRIAGNIGSHRTD
jgi:hypothetical protein